MDFQKQDVAYYIAEAAGVDGRVILSGHLVHITEPTDEQKEQGGETLYEFGHGFSTYQVFETYEKAEDFINEN